MRGFTNSTNKVFMYTGKDKQFLHIILHLTIIKKTKNKIKPWGLSTSALPQSFDHSFSCLAFCSTSVSLISHSANINPNAETAELHLKVGGQKKKKKDENRFITRGMTKFLTGCSEPWYFWVPQGRCALCILHLFTLLFESVHISWSNNRLIVSCDNWSNDSAKTRNRGVNITGLSLNCLVYTLQSRVVGKKRNIYYNLFFSK